MNSNKVYSLYRSLIRAGKKSIGSSDRGLKPMKYKLRQGFEEAKDLNPNKISEQLEKGYRTLRFLETAQDIKSAEHRIVKSLCIMEHYEESYRIRPAIFGKNNTERRKKAYLENKQGYLKTIELLNKTAGLALG